MGKKNNRGRNARPGLQGFQKETVGATSVPAPSRPMVYVSQATSSTVVVRSEPSTLYRKFQKEAMTARPTFSSKAAQTWFDRNARVVGPDAIHVAAVMDRAERLTDEEAYRLMLAGRYMKGLPVKNPRKNRTPVELLTVFTASRVEYRQKARESTDPWFTLDDYAEDTAAWRAAVGPVHPDDPPFTIRHLAELEPCRDITREDAANILKALNDPNYTYTQPKKKHKKHSKHTN